MSFVFLFCQAFDILIRCPTNRCKRDQEKTGHYGCRSDFRIKKEDELNGDS